MLVNSCPVSVIVLCLCNYGVPSILCSAIDGALFPLPVFPCFAAGFSGWGFLTRPSAVTLSSDEGKGSVKGSPFAFFYCGWKLYCTD